MEILRGIIDVMDSVKGEDIVIYDFDKINPFYRYMIVVTAGSERQINAMAVHLRDLFFEKGIDCKVEGKVGATWILVDGKNYVCQIFSREERNNYQLDKLFMAVPKVDVDSLR